MNSTLKDIELAKNEAEIAQKKYDELVANYIKENVDKNNLQSVEKAIYELPECEAKLFLYDWAYDLKNN